jgi:hypothetical protein
MKKTVLLTLTLTLLTGIAMAQTTFGFVEKYGFSHATGGSQRSDLSSMTEFKNKLYISTGSDSGQVFRSPTGNPGTFVRSFTAPNVERINHLTATADGPAGGYLFMGTVPSSGNNAKIMRSSDGSTWEDYFICSSLTDYIESITMFEGTGSVDSVYFGISNYQSGTLYIYRGAVDANDPTNSSSSFTNLIEMFGAFGAEGVSASWVQGDSLYYTTYNGPHLYKTANGATFEENLNFNFAVGGGSYNEYATSMTTFNSEMYYSTRNTTDGSQLWKSADGITFTMVKQFTPDSAIEVRNLYAAGNKLWMTATNYDDELRVYSMDAGGVFYADNMDEFGYPENNPNYGSAITAFQDHLYIGTSSYLDGKGGGKRLIQGHNEVQTVMLPPPASQVWRTCLLDTMPIVTIAGDGDTSVCTGASVTLAANAGMVSYIWNNMNTSQFLSTNAEGYYTVTATDGNGCKNSADFLINNPATVPVFFTDSANNVQFSDIIVCEGDTSVTMLAHPESDAYALQITGLNQGLVTPGSTAFSSRQITVELWVKPTTGTNAEIMTEYDPIGPWSNDNHDMIEYYAGTIYFELPGISEFSTGTMNVNEWNHVVLRYDGSTLTGFVNGVLGGSSSGSWELPTGGSDAFKFGYDFQNGTGSHGAMLGFIKDVRIWNSARADLDIINNMNALAPGTYPDLIYHYMLNEATGTVANDISGNNNNSVAVTGTFVSPEIVTVTPAAEVNSLGNNYFAFHPTQTTTFAATYTNSMGCAVDTAYFTVNVPKMYFTGTTAVCGSVNASFSAYPAGNYTWTPTATTNSMVTTPSPQPTVDTWYYLTGNSYDGNCLMNDSVLIHVGPAFTGSPSLTPINACEESEVTLDANTSGGTAPFTFWWNYTSSPFDSTTVDTLVYVVGSTPSPVYVAGVDALGCPLDLGGFTGFDVTAIPSTDLHGHITTPPPTSVNVDNGFVYVFKHQPGSAGYDTVGFTPLDANGDYLFTPLAAGNYLIKVMPDETDFPLSVPTYYGNAFQWDSSIVYTHGCVQTDTANIQIVMASSVTGTATISGYIIEGPGYGTGARYMNNGGQPNNPFVPGGPLKGIDVKLGKNPAGGIQARTMSDTSANSQGFYEFTNVPPGDYKIYVDIPNLPMDSTRELSIILGDSSVQNNYYADSAMIYISDTSIWAVSVHASTKQYENNFSIYPNPARGDLYVNYTLKESAQVSFEVTNAIGQVIRKEPFRKYPEGKNIFIFNTEQLGLQGGVYFISILSDNKKYTQRLIVID